MGNSNSQTRFAPSLLHNHGSNHKEGKGKKFHVGKFASPENRVLPVATNPPQRLRSTDNGCILQNGGTISGRKANALPIPNNESEFVQVLQKKCHSLQPPSQNVSFQTLYGHRKSHSDPDIVRMMMSENDNESDEDDSDGDGKFDLEETANRRSIIAVSPSKAKIKSRKKKRAPEPPQSNTLPRTLGRTPMPCKNESQRTNGGYSPSHDYGDVPRRPLPPIPPEEMPPPPPPPPPDYNRGSEDMLALKSVTKNYEKNRRTVEKWKFSKPNQESIEKRKRCKSLDRGEEERFRERVENKSERCHRNNSLRNINCKSNESIAQPHSDENKPLNSVLKEAIADAAKKRAERIQRGQEHRNQSFKLSMQQSADIAYSRDQNRLDSTSFVNKPYYPYRSDVTPKYRNSNNDNANSGFERHSKNERGLSEHSTVSNIVRNPSVQKLTTDSRKEYVTDFHGRNIERNPHGEQSNFFSRPVDIVSPDIVNTQNKWDSTFPEPITRFVPEGAVSSSAPSEEEMEIDLQLRPTLPRRPIEISRFSPTDVWKSINLDFFKSHQQRSDVSSDDADDILEEKICRINRPVAPRRLIHDRSGDSGISPDAGSPMLLNDSLDTIVINNPRMCNMSPVPLMNEEHNPMWVPQHDLVDDSECGSDESPLDNRNNISKGNVQAKFSMPNFMFPSRSLPRTDQRNGIDEVVIAEKEKLRSKGRRKKNSKNAEGQHFNSLRNLKKALGLRSKAPIDDSKGLDSNWSLSRSLPNFINNLNGENVVKPDSGVSELYILDHIRRSNSESKAVHQEKTMGKLSMNHSSQNLNSEWRKSFPGQSSEGHVIYLPEYRSNTVPMKNHLVTEDMHVNTDSELVLKKPSNRKKFSYQSTVRQEEKKKLEEKLAREVEARERKRQEEIEWMNKVEEEFRKQRDKEKVNIRHQLRILNLQDKTPAEFNDMYQRELHKNDVAEYIENVYKAQTNNNTTPQNLTDANHSYKNGLDIIPDNNWQQPTGMKKWLKRQNRDNPRLSPMRPEPEGGRSSSDDCKQMDGKKDSTAEKLSQNNSNFYKSNRCKCIHGNELLCRICSSSFARKSYDLSRKDSQLSRSVETISSSVNLMSAKKPESQRISKEQIHMPSENGMKDVSTSLTPDSTDSRFTAESVEEYELHTRLCRTNSGRTFESHSYYALERRKDDPLKYEPIRKTNGIRDKKPNLFSTSNFERELKENVRQKTREFEKRTRKYQLCDYDSDDSASEDREVRHQRPTVRNQKRKPVAELREPSFSRNHPHRNGGRGKPQANGHIVNGRPAYTKSPNNSAILPQQRIPSC